MSLPGVVMRVRPTDICKCAHAWHMPVLCEPGCFLRSHNWQQNEIVMVAHKNEGEINIFPFIELVCIDIHI